MSKDILFKRILESKCPICANVLPKTNQMIVVQYGAGKLAICKKHVKTSEVLNEKKNN